jgi:hypothetical protein
VLEKQLRHVCPVHFLVEFETLSTCNMRDRPGLMMVLYNYIASAIKERINEGIRDERQKTMSKRVSWPVRWKSLEKRKKKWEDMKI